MFYNSFENQGYGPNIGENYPFVYQLQLSRSGARRACSRLRRSATTRRRQVAQRLVRVAPRPLSLVSPAFNFTPTAVNAQGLGLTGASVRLPDPSSHSAPTSPSNIRMTPTLSAQVAYVFTQGLQSSDWRWQQQRDSASACGTSTTNSYPNLTVPFPDFSRWQLPAT